MSLANKIASDMSEILDSAEHQSLFKTAAKKKDKEEDKDEDKDEKKNPFAKKDDKKEDKKNPFAKKDDKKNPFAKKDDKKEDKKSDDKKKKAKALEELFDNISKISTELDNLGLIKSSMYTISCINQIVAEASEEADCDVGMADEGSETSSLTPDQLEMLEDLFGPEAE